jgi:hypothetical protein
LVDVMGATSGTTYWRGGYCVDLAAAGRRASEKRKIKSKSKSKKKSRSKRKRRTRGYIGARGVCGVRELCANELGRLPEILRNTSG